MKLSAALVERLASNLATLAAQCQILHDESPIIPLSRSKPPLLTLITEQATPLMLSAPVSCAAARLFTANCLRAFLATLEAGHDQG